MSDEQFRRLDRAVRAGSGNASLRGQYFRAAARRGLQVIWRGGNAFEFVSTGELVNGYFTPPALQIVNLFEWNTRYGLGFTSKQIEMAWETIPAWPDRQLVAVQLVPYLETVRGTFDRLWQIAASRQKRSWRNPHFDSERGSVRLIEGIEHPGLSLRWEIIECSASWDKERGIAPQDVRDKEKSPHAGILAAAAHHPQWVRSMNGRIVPFVWAPGYECGDLASPLAPWLGFNQYHSEVRLRRYSAALRSSYNAVPAFVGE